MRDLCANRLTVSVLVTMAVTVVAIMPRAAGAEIYKCKGSDGRVVYSDAPCAAQAQQETVRIYDGPRPAAGPGPAAKPDTAAEPDAAARRSTATGNAPPTDCSRWMPPPRRVRVDPPPAFDASGYPKDAQGRPIVSQGAIVNWVLNDKRDLLSVLSACSAMVTECFHRDGDLRNSMDACFNSAPRCRTTKPWEEDAPCCPEACWQRYADQRRQCVDPLTASSRVFFDQHCGLEPAIAPKR